MKAKRSSASNRLGILRGSVSSHLFAIALRNVPSWLSCHSKGCSLAEVFLSGCLADVDCRALPFTRWHACKHCLILLSLSLMKSRKPLPVTSIHYQSSVWHLRSVDGGPRRSSSGRPQTASSHQDLSEPLSAVCWYWVQTKGHQVFPLLLIFTEALSCSPLVRNQHF